MSAVRRLATRGLALASVACFSASCDRAEVWDSYVYLEAPAVGLRGSVALVDPSAERVLVAPVESDMSVSPASFDIGTGFASAAATFEGERLLVLSRGVVPQRRADDDRPMLTVIDGGTTPRLLARYTLSDPLSGIALDPGGALAALYPGADDTAFVQNPNELVIVDLARGPAVDNPVPLTLRSFGGRPQGFTFTPTLGLPGGPRRLLVVQTDRDVALLDLSDLTIPEVTVKLTGGPVALVPGGVAITDGAIDRDDDARVAVRIVNDPNVIIVDLLPVLAGDVATTPQSFRAVPNVVHVGGTPSDVAFVQTDGGLRLAALVPSKSALTLVDPSTGIASEIDLGAPFERLSLVTNVVGAAGAGSDVALLWSGSSPEVAFVALGSTIGTPYKSVDRLALSAPVAKVIDVPSPNLHLKLLAAPDGRSFFVLDLVARTVSPITASSVGTIATASADGARAWMLDPGASSLAQLDLGTLHPRNVALSYAIRDVFDVERRDGGRALVAVHAVGALGLTVLDARDPSLLTSREYVGVLLGDLR